MTTRELNALPIQVLDPVVATATTRTDGLSNADAISTTQYLLVGESGDTLSGSVYWTISLEDSDDDSTYTASSDVVVYIDGVVQSGSTVVIDAATEDDVVVSFAYTGSKLYTEAVATATGTHTNGTPIGGLAVQEVR